MRATPTTTTDRRRQRGQTLVLLALALVPVIGMAGLGIDVGRMYTTRREAQLVADVAAASGAHEQSRSGSKSAFGTVATSYAQRNGYNQAGDTITVHNPPTSGQFVGKNDAYEVIIERTVPTALMKVFGTTSATVRGRAVAIVQKTGVGILLLHPTMAGAFDAGSNTRVNLTSGVMHINSSNSKAMKLNGNATITTRYKSTIVGGYEFKGSSSMTPVPQTGEAVIPDPLAGVPYPSCALPVRNGTAAAPSLYEPANGATICPGVYYGGIDFQNRTVTLDPCGMPPDDAVFVLSNGPFKAGNNAKVTGNGVMIFNTFNKWCAPPVGSTCTALDLNGDLTLIAPGDGQYAGIVIFQDRSCGASMKAGDSLKNVEGEIYAPNSHLQIDKVKASVTASFILKSMALQHGGSGAEDEDPDFVIKPTFGASAKVTVLGE